MTPMNKNEKALRAAQKTLDREYARAIKIVGNYIDWCLSENKKNKKLAKVKVKR